ncbi:MAG: thrombospondin type 3 repeat-containing protein [Pseudomonadota bacterium]
MRKVLLSLILGFLVLLWSTTTRVVANSIDVTASHNGILWLASSSKLVVLDKKSGNVLRSFDKREEARLVGLDHNRGLAWVADYGKNTIRAYSADGLTEEQIDLKDPIPFGSDVLFDPIRRESWITNNNSLLHYDQNGSLRNDFKLRENITHIEYDERNDHVIAATPFSLSFFSPERGYGAVLEDIFGDSLIIATAASVSSDRVFVLAESEIAKVGFNGRVDFGLKLPRSIRYSEVLSDGNNGAWLVGPVAIAHLSPSGELKKFTDPFSGSRDPVIRLSSIEHADGSLWVASRDRAIRIDKQGGLLQYIRLSEEGEDLVSSREFASFGPPTISRNELPDNDGDGIENIYDNCIDIVNPNQVDTNGDGIGNVCDPDFNDDGIVNFLDVPVITAAFNSIPGDAHWNADADLNVDNAVNFLDYVIFTNSFLQPPGASAPIGNIPVIDVLPIETTENPYTISGTVDPHLFARLYVDGELQDVVPTDQSGQYSFEGYLDDGFNVITVVAWNTNVESPATDPFVVNYTNNIPRQQSGTISENTVWTRGSGDPYVISGNLTVPADRFLVIQPGARVEFEGLNTYELVIEGELRVRGRGQSVFMQPTLGMNRWGIEVRGNGTAYIDRLESSYGSIHAKDSSSLSLFDSQFNYENESGTIIRLDDDVSAMIDSNQVLATKNTTHQVTAFYAQDTSTDAMIIISNNETLGVCTAVALEGVSTPVIVASNVFDGLGWGTGGTSDRCEAIDLLDTADIEIRENTIIGHYSGVQISRETGVLSNPIIAGNTIYGNARANIEARNSGPQYTIAATGNYWGSADPWEIGTTMDDRGKDTSRAALVDYSDFLDAPNGSPVDVDIVLGGVLQVGSNVTFQAPTFVIGSMIVPSGAPVTLDAGVDLRFDRAESSFILQNGATLIADGTEENPVRLTSGHGNSLEGLWSGFSLMNGSTLELTHSQISNVLTGIHADGANANVILQNVEIHGIEEFGMIVENGANASVEDSSLFGTSPVPTAVECGTSFLKSRGTGLHIKDSGSELSLTNSHIQDFCDGVVVEQSTINSINTTILDNVAGLRLQSAVDVNFSPNNKIVSNHLGVVINDAFPAFTNSLFISFQGNEFIDNDDHIVASGVCPIYSYDFTGNYFEPNSSWLDIANRIVDDTNELSGHCSFVNWSNFLESPAGSAVVGSFIPSGPIFDSIDGSGGDAFVSNAEYIALGSLVVPDGTGLTIPSGVKIEFKPSTTAGLYVNGSLSINGNEDAFVNLTSYVPGVFTPWGGVTINESSGGAPSVLNNIEISYTRNALQIFDDDVVIDGCYLHDNDSLTQPYHIVTVEDSANVQLRNCIFENNYPDDVAISILFNGDGVTSSLVVENTVFDPNYISASGGSLTILNSLLRERIDLSNMLDVTIQGNTLSGPSDQTQVIRFLSGTSNTIAINDNDIYGRVRLSNQYNGTPINLRDNYWGNDPLPPTVGSGERIFGVDNESQVDLTGWDGGVRVGPFFSGLEISNPFISPSPASANVKDSTDVSISLTNPSESNLAWTAEIVESVPGGNSVASFSGTVTDLVSPISLNWSGDGAPDGEYRLIFNAPNMAGFSSTSEASITVDRMPPTADIISPTDLETIGQDSSVVIQGTAADDNIESYSLKLIDPAGSLDEISIDEKSESILDGILTDWVYTSPDTGVVSPSGDYTLNLTVLDKAGNTAEKNVAISLQAFGFVSVEQRVPGNSTPYVMKPSQGQELHLDIELTTTSDVFLEILTEADEQVIWSNSFPNLAAGIVHTLTWNGLDGGGSHVVDEAYAYRLTATSGQNVSVFDLSRPEPTPGFKALIINTDNSPVIDKYSVYENKYAKVRVESPVASRPTVRFSSEGQAITYNLGPMEPTVFNPNEGRLIVWDLRAEDGTLAGDNFATNYSGTQPSLKPNSVIVRGNSPTVFGVQDAPVEYIPLENSALPSMNVEVLSDPYQIEHSYGQRSVIKFRVDHDAIVSIYMLPPGVVDFGNPAVLVIQEEESLLKNEIGQFTWSGLVENSSNKFQVSDEGAYTFAIVATSSLTNQSTTYKGTLNIYR